jgi:hypothetical protein
VSLHDFELEGLNLAKAEISAKRWCIGKHNADYSFLIRPVSDYSGSFPSFRKSRRRPDLNAHLWIAEGGDPQSGPNGGVLRHVMTEALDHYLVDLVSEPHVI